MMTVMMIRHERNMLWSDQNDFKSSKCGCHHTETRMFFLKLTFLKIRRPWWWTLSSSSRRRSASGNLPPVYPTWCNMVQHGATWCNVKERIPRVLHSSHPLKPLCRSEPRSLDISMGGSFMRPWGYAELEGSRGSGRWPRLPILWRLFGKPEKPLWIATLYIIIIYVYIYIYVSYMWCMWYMWYIYIYISYHINSQFFKSMVFQSMFQFLTVKHDRRRAPQNPAPRVVHFCFGHPWPPGLIFDIQEIHKILFIHNDVYIWIKYIWMELSDILNFLMTFGFW